MKAYKRLDIFVKKYHVDDIMTSSSDVITESVTVPWQKQPSFSEEYVNDEMGTGSDIVYET